MRTHTESSSIHRGTRCPSLALLSSARSLCLPELPAVTTTRDPAFRPSNGAKEDSTANSSGKPESLAKASCEGDRAEATLIVVIHFGRDEELKRSLSSLRTANRLGPDVLVVDNNPTDNARAFVQTDYPGVQYHWTGDNLGFSGGCNVGLRRALEQRYGRVLVLNNDVDAEKGSIEAIEAAIDSDPAIGVAGAITFARDTGKPLYAGAYINWWRGKPVIRARHWPYTGDVPYDVDIVSGCVMMFRRETIESVGLFDDRYFLYWEDVDMCFRARKVGYRTVMVPGSRMMHGLSVTTGYGSPLVTYYETRNRLLFFRDHAPSRLRRYWLTARVSIGQFRKGFKQYRRGERDLGRAYVRGVLDYYIRRLGRSIGMHL